jgi:hypothetical protein
MFIAVVAYALEKLDEMTAQQITELIVTFGKVSFHASKSFSELDSHDFPLSFSPSSHAKRFLIRIPFPFPF